MSLTEAGVQRLQARLRALNTEALAYTPREKAALLTTQWRERPRAPGADPDWDRSRELVEELSLIMPSLLGVTAFDRLARAMTGRSEEDRQAVTLHRASRHRVLRHHAGRVEDLASGETVVLASSRIQGDIVARFAPLADGRLIDCGPILPLDEDALAVVQTHIRPHRQGIRNAVRCVEAVYRHCVRHGAPADPWPAEPWFNPDRDPIDRLAADWAELRRDPTPPEQARARPLASVATLVETLSRVTLAQKHEAAALVTAYRWIAAIMVETLALRRAHGSAVGALDQVARALDEGIVAGTHPEQARALFDSLRASARRTAPPAGAETDLDKLVGRIQALRAKTVEQGCTEQEALAAAEKVAELLDRYGLSLSELDLRKQTCEGIGVETGRKRRGPIDDCMGTIALFFDCRVWAEMNADATLRYVFFGMPADVQAAVYLHDLVTLAFGTETALFQAGPVYGKTATGERRNATTSFQTGLSRGINEKLAALRRGREQAAPNRAGRALVPVKQSIIDTELERLGLNLRRRAASRRYVQREAYSAGQAAGARFEYRPGIAGERAG